MGDERSSIASRTSASKPADGISSSSSQRIQSRVQSGSTRPDRPVDWVGVGIVDEDVRATSSRGWRAPRRPMCRARRRSRPRCRERSSWAATRAVGPRVRQQTERVPRPPWLAVAAHAGAEHRSREGLPATLGRTVEAAVTIAALPVAALALWALLRAPAARAPARRPPDGRALARAGHPDLRRRRHLLRARGRRRARPSPSARSSRMGAGRDPRRLRRCSSSPASSTTSAPEPDREARRRSSPPPAIVLAAGLRSRSSATTCSASAIGALLARRDHERLQPARQHGRARGDARHRRVRRSSRSTPSTVHENDLVLVLSLSLAFACLGFLPFNLRPGDGARVFMGDSGSQVLGFLLAALGLAASWTTAGTTVATMLLPLLVLAIPILDTTLVTVAAARRAAAGHPGRQGPHLAPARLLRPLRAEGRGAARADRGRARRDLASPTTCSTGRRSRRSACSSRSPCSSSSGASSPSSRSRSGAAGRATRDSATPSRCSRGGSSSCSSTSCSSSGTFLAAYLLFVDGRGTELQRGTLPRRAADRARARATSSSSSSASTGARGATRRRATCSRSGSRRGVATLVAYGIVARDARPRRLPARGSSSSYGLAAAAARSALALVRPVRPRGGRSDRTTADGGCSSSAPGRAGRGAGRATCASAADVRVVGFLDDNPRLRRRRVQGVPVLGSLGDARPSSSDARDEVVVTIPDAPRRPARRRGRACAAAGVACIASSASAPSPLRPPTRALAE